MNISKEEYSRQLSMYRDAGISTYTELILGLPGETLESFSHGLCELLELGQHSSVSAYYCELLPNAEMSRKDYMEKYGIKTVSTSLNQYHCEPMDDVLSGLSHIVVQTNTMSSDDWIKANFFSTCVQSFHHFGLTQCFAVYARKEQGISYYDFYKGLLRYIETSSEFCKEIFINVKKILTGFVNGKCGLVYQDDKFGPITYPLEEAVFLLCLYNSDKFYSEIQDYLKKFVDDEKIFEELMRYQKSIILRPNRNNFVEEFDYDFKNYFGKILSGFYEKLEQKNIRYSFSTPFESSDWVEYAKIIIWYGRRNGRMIFSNLPNKIDELD